MAQTVVQTPRDKLQRLLDYAVRARRYWWLVAISMVAGGGLSVAFAMSRTQLYESSAVLFYQERIQTALLQGRDAAVVQRNIGERYRELLTARTQLAKIIEDPALNPFPDELEKNGLEAAVEELKLAVDFQVRGANTFHIIYKDADPERAKAVTERLTELLTKRESDLRLEQANATVTFAQEQLDQATADLLAHEKERAQFLVAHPEFAEDEQGGGGGEGAAVRRRGERESAASRTPSNPRVTALERQRARIVARLSAADGRPVRTPTSERAPSAAELEARRKVTGAEEELRQRQRDVEAMRGRGLTEAHPDIRNAKDALAVAQQRLKRAEAELAAVEVGISEPVAPPSSPNERAALERDLTELEQQISRERSRAAGNAPPQPKKNDIADQVVQLETKWAQLRREVAEQAERVESLSKSVFQAQLSAQTRIAEQGTALQVVDPAYLPQKPIGSPKKMLVMAGLVVFTGLGLMLAVGLAIIDDRLYRRVDVEQLGVAPLLAVIPKAVGRRRKRK